MCGLKNSTQNRGDLPTHYFSTNRVPKFRQERKVKEVVELKIDHEFEALIPPMSDEEFRQLRENIISEGKVRDSIKTWSGVILDGHNRWRIIQENPHIPFQTEELEFSTRNEAKAWIIRNQLGRRNLPNYERAKLALQLKPILQEEAKKRQATSTGGENPQLVPKSAQAEKGRVRDELAKIAGVGHDTIEKVQVIEKSATPEEKQQLSRGETSVNKVFTAIREREKPRGYTKADREGRAQTEAIVAEMYDTSTIRQATIDTVIDDIKLNAVEYIKSLRNVLTDHSTLLDEETRPMVADLIQRNIIDELLKLKGLIERK